jgi:Amt family ammonium transporter
MLSILMQTTMIACVVMLIWVIYGYSFAFGGSHQPLVGWHGQAFPGRRDRLTACRPPSAPAM